ncbi:glycosyltransferase family 9 protein [Endothiovibrio diazotrophicus]
MNEVRSILFITLSNIGDVVMTTPVLERLHGCFPEAVVDIVADPRSRILFEHCPYRGEILTKPKGLKGRAALAWLKGLRAKRYDLIVDLRTDFVAWLLRGRRRFTKLGANPLGPHSVEQHMGVIRRLCGETLPPAAVWPGAEAERQAESLLTAGTTGGRRLALAPGANWEGKIWATARFIELIEKVSDHFDSVVLIGGPADRERCAAIAAASPLPVLDLAGRCDLLTSAALLRHCAAFVGNDSGPGHLAAAAGLPTITVFGPGEPQRYHPWGPRARWLRGIDDDLARLDAGVVAAALVEQLTQP